MQVRKLFQITLLPLSFAAMTAAATEGMSIRYMDYQLAAGQAKVVAGTGGALHHASYINQPTFSHDGSRLLWTQQSGSGPMDTDIYFKVLASDEPAKPLVKSPFGEFSATPMPEQAQLYSVVRVEADGTQRLWQMGAGADKLLYPELSGVGYHVWGADQDLLVFLLEDKQQPNRAVYRSKDGSLITLAGHIGRSLLYQGKTDQFYFTAPLKDMPANSVSWLWQYQAGTKQAKALLPLPAQGEDLALSADGDILLSSGRYIFRLSQMQWQPFLDLREQCQGHVSRFKLNPVKPMIAFVCQQESP